MADDASGDATPDVAAAFAAADPRIRLIRLPVNQGAYGARNAALAQATGELVTCQDADDWSHPARIARHARALLKRPDGVANVSRWARATGALAFERRPFTTSVINFSSSSITFRRAPVLDRIGGWDDALASFDVEPILVFRRPDDFVRARYQENVQKEVRPRWTSFADFNREGRDSMLQYADNAELFAEVFPKTRVMIYEDLAGGDGFCERFFAALGIDVSGLPEPGRVRAGLSAAQIAAKLALADIDDKHRTNAELMKLLRSPGVVTALERNLGAGPFGFWTDPAEREQVVQAQEADLERLRVRFLPERATLFPPLPVDEPPPVPPFSEALRGELAKASAKAPARTKVARGPGRALDRTKRAIDRGAS